MASDAISKSSGLLTKLHIIQLQPVPEWTETKPNVLLATNTGQSLHSSPSPAFFCRVCTMQQSYQSTHQLWISIQTCGMPCGVLTWRGRQSSLKDAVPDSPLRAYITVQRVTSASGAGRGDRFNGPSSQIRPWELRRTIIFHGWFGYKAVDGTSHLSI